MLSDIKDPKEARDAMLSLLPTAATLAGISIGLTSIANAKASHDVETMADDLFLFSGFGFLAACYLIYFAMRITEMQRLTRWMRAIDYTFLASLTLIVVSGALVVYEFV